MGSQAVREGDEPSLAKVDPVLEKIHRDHPSARTIGDLAWAAVEKLGVQERRRDPALTREQAVAKALHTIEGAALYQWTRPPWRDLGLEEAVQKAETRRWLDSLGFVNWGHCVAEAAEAISPDDLTAGMAKVEKRYPTIWKMYVEERGH